MHLKDFLSIFFLMEYYINNFCTSKILNTSQLTIFFDTKNFNGKKVCCTNKKVKESNTPTSTLIG